MKMKKDDIYSSAGTKFESSTTADNLQVSPAIGNTNAGRRPVNQLGTSN